MAEDRQFLTLRVEEDLNRRVEKVAKSLGLTKSSYIRMILLRELKKAEKEK